MDLQPEPRSVELVTRTVALDANQASAADVLSLDGVSPAQVYLARLAPGSRRTMRAALEKIARLVSLGEMGAFELPWQDLSYAHTAAVRAALAETLAPATVNKHLAALRSVLSETWRLGYMSHEDMARAGDLQRVNGTRLPAGRALPHQEIEALLEVCARDPRPVGIRDGTILACLYGLSVRRTELANIAFGDIDWDTGEIHIHGKGDRERAVYANPEVLDRLVAWRAVRGHHDGPLFCAITKGGTLRPGGLTAQSVRDVVARRAAQAGLTRTSPHDLRRSSLSLLLDAGVDPLTVSKHAGNSVRVLAVYDRRDETAKRRAVSHLRLPA